MTSAILPSKQVAKACASAINQRLELTNTGAPVDRDVIGLLHDLMTLADMASQAEGAIDISLEHFGLIRDYYKPR